MARQSERAERVRRKRGGGEEAARRRGEAVAHLLNIALTAENDGATLVDVGRDEVEHSLD